MNLKVVNTVALGGLSCYTSHNDTLEGGMCYEVR